MSASNDFKSITTDCKELRQTLEARDILGILPHRFPFIVIDRVIKREGGYYSKGIKQVTCTEPYLQGHFPGNPSLPVSIQIESMGQLGAAAILDAFAHEGNAQYILFGGLDNAVFHRPIYPGETMELESRMSSFKGASGKTTVTCSVDGEIVAQADYLFRLVPKEEV